MNNKEQLETPVAFIIFNRPDTTRQVFGQIRKVRPKKLYVIADGPRKGFSEDASKVIETRAIIDAVDWECNVVKKYSDSNLGCGLGPSTGISWVFEQEDESIILEDDCLPGIPFFYFCEELLIRYRDEARVYGISGNNLFEERIRNEDSYFFSKYSNSWGWASWRRVWEKYDYDMKKWPAFRDARHMEDVFRTKAEVDRFIMMFDGAYASHEQRWDTQFAFTIWSNDGLCIIPRKNLVSNIGMVGTHASKGTQYHNLPISNSFRVTKHPDFILPNIWYDEYAFNNQWKYKNNIINRIYKKLERTVFLLLKKRWKVQ